METFDLDPLKAELISIRWALWRARRDHESPRPNQARRDGYALGEISSAPHDDDVVTPIPRIEMLGSARSYTAAFKPEFSNHRGEKRRSALTRLDQSDPQLGSDD